MIERNETQIYVLNDRQSQQNMSYLFNIVRRLLQVLIAGIPLIDSPFAALGGWTNAQGKHTTKSSLIEADQQPMSTIRKLGMLRQKIALPT